MTTSLDRKIEDAKRLHLGGVLRFSVFNRLKHAVLKNEKYTHDQFEYWITCLNDAARMVENPVVEAGIYRDMGGLLAAYGDNIRAIEYYRRSISLDHKSPFVKAMNSCIAFLQQKELLNENEK